MRLVFGYRTAWCYRLEYVAYQSSWIANTGRAFHLVSGPLLCRHAVIGSRVLLEEHAGLAVSTGTRRTLPLGSAGAGGTYRWWASGRTAE